MLKPTKCVYLGGALSAANLRVKTDVSFNPIKSINIVQMNYFNYKFLQLKCIDDVSVIF